MKENYGELMERIERLEISWKKEKTNLEHKLKTQNLEVEKLRARLEEVEMQMTDFQTLEKTKILKSEWKGELKKELDKVLATAVERALRDLPFEIVCTFRNHWNKLGVVNYNKIMVEFNNSDRPGGADAAINIFTTFTSGYYIITL